MTTKIKLLLASLLFSPLSALADTVASGQVTVTASFSFPTSCSLRTEPVNFGQLDAGTKTYRADSNVDIECKNLRSGQKLKLNIDGGFRSEGSVAYVESDKPWQIGVSTENGGVVYEHMSTTNQARKIISVPVRYHLKLESHQKFHQKFHQEFLANNQLERVVNMSIPLQIAVID